MPSDAEDILALKARIRELEADNQELKRKLDRARGIPAEILVAQMTNGKRTQGYKDSYDIATEKGNRIEVKLSKVHHYKGTSTRRWTWDNLLGTKEYDYLVLAGEKDSSRDDYPPDFAYVFFLVPRSEVNEINSAGNCVALNTNFATVRAPKSRILIERHMVRSQDEFKRL